MLTGFDHLVIAVVDPDAAAEALERELGIAVTGGGRHDALGTRNRLAWLGESYLELIGVEDPDRAARSWVGVPTLRALAGTLRGGLATWAVGSDALDDDVALLRARGTDLLDPLAGARTRPDGRIVRWRLAAPRRLGPLEPPFLIEHDVTAAEWTPEERAERAALPHPVGGRVRLAGLDLPVGDVRRAGTRFLAAGIGPFRPSLVGRGARDATIGTGVLRLIPTPSAPADPSDESVWPLVTIRLRVEGRLLARTETDLLGCRWVVGGA